MADPISFCLRVRVREGRLQPLRSLMRELIAATEAEPGTLTYQWFVSEDDTACHIYERYADTAALLAHLDSFAGFAERFMACVEPVGLDVYGLPDPEGRAALDALGAVYLDSIGGFAR